MQFRELAIPDAFECVPAQLNDDRGVFLEWFRLDELSSYTGAHFELQQANMSVSRRGVLRGIHFASVPLGQAKVVTAVHGTVLDVVVDLRLGSPTFGQHDSVVLDDRERRTVYLSEGLGHAFLAMSEEATVAYLASDVYRPDHEFGINPLDPDLLIRWPVPDAELRLSDKDVNAPTLAEAQQEGILPTFEVCRQRYASLAAGV